MGNHVEAHGLGKRSALSDGDDISLLNAESGRAVNSNVLVPLLVTAVLGDVVKVVTTHDDGAVHLGTGDNSLENAATDVDITSEGALLVNVGSLDGGRGSLDSKTDVLHITHGLDLLGANHTLASYENSILALVGLLVLITFNVCAADGGHDFYLFNDNGSNGWTKVSSVGLVWNIHVCCAKDEQHLAPKETISPTLRQQISIATFDPFVAFLVP